MVLAGKKGKMLSLILHFVSMLYDNLKLLLLYKPFTTNLNTIFLCGYAL